MASSRHPSENKSFSEKKPSKEQMQEAKLSGRGKADKDEELDEALRDSFPASDPVSISQPTAATPSLGNRDEAGAGDNTRKQLHDRVNVADKNEVEYWTERLGVSEAKLKEAVKSVGFFPREVAHYLGKTL